MRWLTGLIFVGLLAAPGAGAQTSDGPIEANLVLSIEDRPEPIPPGGPAAEYTWNVTLYLQAPVPQAIDVEIVPPEDDEISFLASPSTVTIHPDPRDDATPPFSYTASGLLSVAVGPNASAFHAESYEIAARTNGTELVSSAEGVSHATVTPGFRPGLDAEPLDPTLTVPAGDQIHARVTLENTGNGDERVTYEQIDAPDGCSVDPIHEVLFIDRARLREAVFHLVCEDGASGGELSITYGAVYAPDTSVPGTEATATWDVVVDHDAATQTQASLIGTPANLGGVPIAAWAVLALGAIVGVGRRLRSGKDA